MGDGVAEIGELVEVERREVVTVPQHKAPITPPYKISLIEKLLPEEMLLHIFERLPITALAAAQCVCRQWRSVGATA